MTDKKINMTENEMFFVMCYMDQNRKKTINRICRMQHWIGPEDKALKDFSDTVRTKLELMTDEGFACRFCPEDEYDAGTE